MDYDFSQFNTELKEAEKWLAGELQGIRTGRAAAKILDSVRVDSYGSKVLMHQIGNISTEDARTLRIVIWDSSLVSAAEKAILDADIGVSASTDDKGLRVHFPELTEESRSKFLKIAKEKHEDARITVRNARDGVWNDIQDEEQKGEISEDEKYRLKEKMQEMVDKANNNLDALIEKKEKEISA